MDPNLLPKSDAPTAQSGEPNLNQDQFVDESSVIQRMKEYDLKHSGPGIASFIISLVSIVGYIVTFLVIGIMASSLVNEDDSLLPHSSETITLLGLAVLVLAALNVIGVVIGIIGLALRKRRKVFGIIGTIINGVIILLFMLLITTFLINAGTL